MSDADSDAEAQKRLIETELETVLTRIRHATPAGWGAMVFMGAPGIDFAFRSNIHNPEKVTVLLLQLEHEMLQLEPCPLKDKMVNAIRALLLAVKLETKP